MTIGESQPPLCIKQAGPRPAWPVGWYPADPLPTRQIRRAF